MRKILLSLITIVTVSAAVIKGTQALFSDTETSNNNTFAVGTLDLKVDNQDDPNIVHVTLSNMKPGATASYLWTLSNTGSLTGDPWVEIINVNNYDNDCSEPEESEPDGSCGNPGLGEGELGDYLMMKLNAPGNVGYIYPNAPTCIGGNKCTLNYWSTRGDLSNIDGQVWNTIAPTSTLAGPMVLEFEILTTTGNIIQSDSVEFDVVFHLDQVAP